MLIKYSYPALIANLSISTPSDGLMKYLTPIFVISMYAPVLTFINGLAGRLMKQYIITHNYVAKVLHILNQIKGYNTQ